MMDRSSLRVIADKNCPQRVLNIVSADIGEMMRKTHFGNLFLINKIKYGDAIEMLRVAKGICLRNK